MENLSTLFRGCIALIALIGVLKIGMSDSRNATTAIIVGGTTVGIVLSIEALNSGKKP